METQRISGESITEKIVVRKPIRGRLRIITTAWMVAALGISATSCRRQDAESEKTEGSQSLAMLPPEDRKELKRYTAEMEPAEPPTPAEVNASIITDEDVWLGMRYEGLHRFDRKMKTWESYVGRDIGYRILKIWQEGTRIWVEHLTMGSHGFCYVSYTDDRGQTWKKFLLGNAPGAYVHAAQFTNQGLRSEWLQGITKSLRQGKYPEEIVDHLEVDGEIYFTIYVNCDEGWNTLYRYDVASDRLRDLAITELDPGAVGVRQFYLDPREPRFVWILSGGYGGPIQLPRRWFVYERGTEETRDMGVDYSGEEGYLHLVDGEWEYMDIISFEPDRVVFFGGDEQQIQPVGQYDRATKQVRHL